MQRSQLVMGRVAIQIVQASMLVAITTITLLYYISNPPTHIYISPAARTKLVKGRILASLDGCFESSLEGLGQTCRRSF